MVETVGYGVACVKGKMWCVTKMAFRSAVLLDGEKSSV